jgi:polysaccharide biosynthesis protein PslH
VSYVFLIRYPPFPPVSGADFAYARNLMLATARYRPTQAVAFERSDIALQSTPGVEWTFVAHKEPRQWQSLFSSLPGVAARHVSRPFIEATLFAAQKAEAIFVDFIGLAWCVEPIRKAMGDKGPPIIVISHNHEHSVRLQMARATTSLPLRAALAVDAFKAGRLEKRSNWLADGITANTEADRQAFAAYTTTPSIVVSPGYSGRAAPSRNIDANTPPVISIMGNYGSHHKRMVLAMALKALSARGLDRRYRIDIVGHGDSSEFERQYPGFHFLGFVENLEAYLAGTRLGLLPDAVGGGFKNRALAYGFNRVPMLALHHAMDGMEFEQGRHFLGVETLDDMALIIPSLMEDFSQLNALQEAAFVYSTSGFSWETRGHLLHTFAQDLLASRQN